MSNKPDEGFVKEGAQSVTEKDVEKVVNKSEEIKKKFKTQIALCNAIGAKDGSYVTGYVTGNNRIGNILREKLEAVGVDVNYILYGKRTEEAKPKPGSGQELSDLLFQCTEKIIHLQNAVIEMNKELLDVNQLLETVKKSVTKS